MHPSPKSFYGFLGLTLLAGLVVLWPYHNFQPFLSQGDHGRDLYAAQAVLRGELPYRDFWWVYGPLMPYYYALFFKILGTKISSVLIGKMMLNLIAGLFLFCGIGQWLSPLAALTAAAWFMTFHSDFFFTYNHAGGIAILMGILWMHLGFLRRGTMAPMWGAAGLVFLLGLIKINFALVAFAMTIGLLLLALFLRPAGKRPSKLLWTTLVLLVPLAWWLIYSFLLQGLSTAEIRQCLPYLEGDEPYNKLGPLETFPMLAQIILQKITANSLQMAFAGFLILSIGIAAWRVWQHRKDEMTQAWVMVMLYASVFYVLNLHEFLKSGVFYRSFWAEPQSVLLCFMVIGWAVTSVKPRLQAAVWLALLVVVAVSFNAVGQQIKSFKNPHQYLGGPRGGVYVTNDPAWMQTVVRTTKQLHENFKKDELFLSLPYDVLYYYLTDKKSPTRQLIFFDHIKIPLDQEQKIIAELKTQKVSGILVSSRQSAREPGLGTLGVSYCPMMAQYINTNFVPVAKLGDWEHEPGWAWNHGTLIFKRK